MAPLSVTPCPHRLLRIEHKTQSEGKKQGPVSTTVLRFSAPRWVAKERAHSNCIPALLDREICGTYGS